MSDLLRIGLVAEGYTDKVVLDAAVGALLGERPYLLRLLQPEESLPLEPVSKFTGKGKGWGGVYLWCQESRIRSGGGLRDDPLFLEYDILILHLDADVGGKKYSDCEINDPATDLPCEEPCPPASTTTNRLRKVLLRWVGETNIPAKTILCTPSKSTEAWVVAALFPGDTEMLRKGWECHPNPETRLSIQPKEHRLSKTEKDYKGIRDRISVAWPQVRQAMTEADRFSCDLVAAVPAVSS
jgi:hypothetical protein